AAAPPARWPGRPGRSPKYRAICRYRPLAMPCRAKVEIALHHRVIVWRTRPFIPVKFSPISYANWVLRYGGFLAQSSTELRVAVGQESHRQDHRPPSAAEVRV